MEFDVTLPVFETVFESCVAEVRSREYSTLILKLLILDPQPP
jgi:hypothetical protein